MIFDETIIPSTTSPWKYGMVVLNPDWSSVWGWSASSTPYTMKAYYSSDATYDIEYYAEANPGTALNTNLWRIFRVRSTKIDGKFFDKTWAGNSFNRPATDLATVEALTYN